MRDSLKACTVAATLCLAIAVLYGRGLDAQRPARDWVDAEQTLSIQYGVWRSGSAALRITEDQPKWSLLKESDRRLLFQWLETGTLNIVGADATKITPARSMRMIVIFTEGLTVPASLGFSEDETVLYVQQGNKFRRFPPGLQLGSTTLEIKPVDGKPDLYDTSYGHPYGGRSGGRVYIPR